LPFQSPHLFLAFFEGLHVSFLQPPWERPNLPIGPIHYCPTSEVPAAVAPRLGGGKSHRDHLRSWGAPR
jgi:hypothetical protein